MRKILKRILVALGLFPIVLAFLNRVKKPFRRTVNKWLLWTTRLRGGSYTDFYERMMDRRARGAWTGKSGAAVTGTPEERRRRFAPEYFATHGWITPATTFLDYGCGGGATGVNFILHLGPGRYTGADISSECLERARGWVATCGLSHKNPNFVHLSGGSLAALAGKKFDVIYAQDVVVHMPPEAVRQLIRDMADFIHERSVFLLTFTYADSYCEYQNDNVNGHHNSRFFMDAIKGTRLDCEEVREWATAGYKPTVPIRMARFRLRPSAAISQPRAAAAQG